MKAVALVTVTLVAFTLSACGDTGGADTTPEFDRYTQMCHQKGGVVSPISVGWSTVTYNCIGSGPNELLPRFGAP